MAGALGVQLGGTNYYGGLPEARPHLGESIHALTPGRIREALNLMWATAVLALGSAVGLVWA